MPPSRRLRSHVHVRCPGDRLMLTLPLSCGPRLPRYAVCQVCHKGANLERFIVGRQTILLFVVFVISRLGSHSQIISSDGDDQDFYMGDWTWARYSGLGPDFDRLISPAVPGATPPRARRVIVGC